MSHDTILDMQPPILVISNFIRYFENCFKRINHLSVFIDGGE